MKYFRTLWLAAMAAMCIFSTNAQIKVGAESTDEYIPLLKGKKVALLSNHTGMVGDKHVVDIMLEKGVNVTTIFSPEHGFRGNADAGEHVKSSVDPETGIPIASLYDGGKREPKKEVMDNIDIIVVDIQDVGLRFYTYYCTMVDLMNAAAKYGKKFHGARSSEPQWNVCRRPDSRHEIRIGRRPVANPVVHGMTLGELAQMANGEGWLKDGKKVPLTVIKCKNYTHQSRYVLPIPPSPNLPNIHSIYLYPSMCYFEATPVSLGRGTTKPFQIYGHPNMTGYDFSFTPRSVPGAKKSAAIEQAVSWRGPFRLARR